MAATRKDYHNWLKAAGALLFMLTTGLGLYFLWKENQIRKASFSHYKNFNTYIPDGYQIHGIDVSKYQRFVDWEKVEAMQVGRVKIGFAFVKATEGEGRSDPQYHRNWRLLGKTGIRRGAYLFFRANRSGQKQAEFFLKKVQLERGDLPPVVDVETLDGATPARLQKELATCLSLLEAEAGCRPMLYTNVRFYERNLGKPFDRYPLWAAHYFQRNRPRIEREWHFWQHSEQARVNGITTPVDMNVFAGDSLDFHRLLVR